MSNTTNGEFGILGYVCDVPNSGGTFGGAGKGFLEGEPTGQKIPPIGDGFAPSILLQAEKVPANTASKTATLLIACGAGGNTPVVVLSDRCRLNWQVVGHCLIRGASYNGKHILLSSLQPGAPWVVARVLQ